MAYIAFASIKSRLLKMDELVVKAREKQPGLIDVDPCDSWKNQNYFNSMRTVCPIKPIPYPLGIFVYCWRGWVYSFEMPKYNVWP